MQAVWEASHGVDGQRARSNDGGERRLATDLERCSNWEAWVGGTVGRQRDLDRYHQDMVEHADGAGRYVCDPTNRGLR